MSDKDVIDALERHADIGGGRWKVDKGGRWASVWIDEPGFTVSISMTSARLLAKTLLAAEEAERAEKA